MRPHAVHAHLRQPTTDVGLDRAQRQAAVLGDLLVAEAADEGEATSICRWIGSRRASAASRQRLRCRSSRRLDGHWSSSSERLLELGGQRLLVRGQRLAATHRVERARARDGGHPGGDRAARRVGSAPPRARSARSIRRPTSSASVRIRHDGSISPSGQAPSSAPWSELHGARPPATWRPAPATRRGAPSPWRTRPVRSADARTSLSTRCAR